VGSVRVLVTGGKGFIGAHLAAELDRRGHDVHASSRDDGDLAAEGVAGRLIDLHEPELVLHLAARVGRLAGENDPLETVRQNAGVTLLVARACAARGVELVYGSTSEIYGNLGEAPASEDDPVLALPDSVYGLSKRWGEEAALLQCPDAMLLRFCMPYGPGVRPGRGRGAITNMLDHARQLSRIPAYRGVERSWCWIGDAARAAALAVERGDAGAWNVGRDDSHVSMAEVARLACRLAGAPEELVDEVDPPVGLAPGHRIATEKLDGLGWRPEVDLEAGMGLTLDWLRAT
jgi:nucleoside-diphosphate-sugar epimerase